mmetsp:Transcript_64456/g.122195  ORF Transcript_64456/g.122195 Transcript_64456/m.122195 type:complete len:213 (-) Transcript_64456:616-1254(-)
MTVLAPNTALPVVLALTSPTPMLALLAMLAMARVLTAGGSLTLTYCLQARGELPASERAARTSRMPCCLRARPELRTRQRPARTALQVVLSHWVSAALNVVLTRWESTAPKVHRVVPTLARQVEPCSSPAAIVHSQFGASAAARIQRRQPSRLISWCQQYCCCLSDMLDKSCCSAHCADQDRLAGLLLRLGQLHLGQLRLGQLRLKATAAIG